MPGIPHCILLVLLILWSPISSAAPPDHIVERAWLEDPAGTLVLEDVSALGGEPFERTLSAGFGRSTIWIRLRIDPTAHPRPTLEPDRLYLRIRPVYLDEIAVFDALAPGGRAADVGDRYAPGVAENRSMDFLVPLVRGDAPRDVWLQVRSTSTRQIDVQALNFTDFYRLSHTQSVLFAFYIGLVFVFAIWAVVNWLFTRELLIGGFGVAQLSALIFAVCSLGYLRLLWPEGWPPFLLNHLTSLASVVSVSAAIWFHALLLRDFKPPRHVKILHAGMLTMLPIKLALLGTGSTIEALKLNMMEVLISPLLFLISVRLCSSTDVEGNDKPPLSRQLMTWFYVLLLGMLAVAALPGLGLVPGGEITLYIVQAHGLVTSLLVLLLLQYRARILHRRHSEAAIALQKTLVEAEHEREMRREQETLFSMLAHELKTPLAIMELRIDNRAEGSEELRQAIREINRVVERCVQSNQLNEHNLTVMKGSEDLVRLTRDCMLICTEPSRIQLEAPDSVPVQTDRQLLAIIITNLIENASKYSASDSTIGVGIHVNMEKGVVRLDVRNRPGTAGWPDPDRVFEKYYRSAHARRQTGTGLGLFIVMNLAKALDIEIHYSPDEHFVRFVLEIPC